MKNMFKAGLLVVTLLICLVTALFAQDRWGVYCFDHKQWIGGHYQVEREANEVKQQHFEQYHHTINVLRCSGWNDNCTKDLSK